MCHLQNFKISTYSYSYILRCRLLCTKGQLQLRAPRFVLCITALCPYIILWTINLPWVPYSSCNFEHKDCFRRTVDFKDMYVCMYISQWRAMWALGYIYPNKQLQNVFFQSMLAHPLPAIDVIELQTWGGVQCTAICLQCPFMCSGYHQDKRNPQC